MIDYAAILIRRHPDREWTLNGDDYEGLTMLDGEPAPSKKSLDDAWPSVQAEMQAEKSAKDAAAETGRAKLAKLGFTDDELKALLGL